MTSIRSLLVLLALPAALAAQDTTQSGVRVGITYTPGTRPTLGVVPSSGGAVFDSVRAMIRRDLDFSDRFEMLERGVVAPAMQNRDSAVAALGRTAGARYMVVVEPTEGRPDMIRVALVETESGRASWQGTLPVAGAAGASGRMAAHRAADDIVRAAVGQPGVAATALLYVRNGRVWRVDGDGASAAQLRTAGFPSLSPAWSPDGRRFAYTAFVRSGQPIVVQDFASGARELVPGTEMGLNITPVFAPDGRRLAFAHGTEAGTDIYLSEARGSSWGPAAALTAGRFADNLSPAWSPDGSRLAFISNRARSPQVYVMGSDGTGQEVLARFDFGATGQSSAPAWSPDGSSIAFHREVRGDPQIFILDVATRGLRQITGSGRNEDPSWSPDSRHLAFVSSRTGQREIWVVDLETGRLRQLTTGGGARLPAWSPRLEEGRE
jgi:TolB protein